MSSLSRPDDYPRRDRLILTVWVACCILLFSFLRFPYDNLKGRIEALANQSGHPLRITHITAALPLNLMLEGLSLNGVQLNGKIILTPRLLPLLPGRMGLKVEALQPDGSLSAEMTAPLRPQPEAPLKVAATAENFDVSQLRGLMAPQNAEALSGRLSGTAELTWPAGAIYRGTGRCDMNLANGNLPLTLNSLPFDSLGVKRLRIAASMDSGALRIERAELSGSLSGSISGRFDLQPDLLNSNLNLSGSMTLPAGFNLPSGNPSPDGRSSFTIGGTLNHPILK